MLEVQTRDVYIMHKLVAVINFCQVSYSSTMDRGPKKAWGEIEVGSFKIVELKDFRKTGTVGYAYWFIGGGLFTVVYLS